MSKNIVQMNNSFIQNEHQRRKYMMEERQKRNRFMGWVLILIMLLFILPTYNLTQSYQQLLERRQQLADLKKQYQELSDEKDKDKKADHSGSYGMRTWHWRHILSSCVRY